MTDPNDLVTTYTYNTLNQLERTDYHDGTEEKQEYDLVGNVISKHVYNRDGTDADILYGYDNIYRLKTIEYPALDLNNAIKRVEYTYDDNGNRESMIEKNKDDATLGQIDYFYNNRNWLTEDTRKYQGISGTLTDGYTNLYNYNIVGDLTSTTYPGGKTVEYDIDQLHRTNSVTLEELGKDDYLVSSYEYFPMGTISKVEYGDSENIVGDFLYDDRDRMTDLLYNKKDGSLLLKHNYKYDAVGNRTELKESDSISGTQGKVTAYGYDELYRLISVDHKERVSSGAIYEYDPSGNRTFMHQDQGDFDYTIATNSNQLDKIISNGIGHTDLIYDENGNLINENDYKAIDTEETNNYSKDFTWDYENRLMSVVIDRDDKIFTVNFAYNGDGQRIYKEVKGPDDQVESKLLYVYNSFGEVVEEHEYDLSDSTFKLSSSYVFGNGKRIMSISATDEKTYYLSDILGSNSLLTDKDGEPTMLTKYDEFGNTYYEWADTNKRDNDYKYTGKPLDKETGLYYYGARYYNPQWGRWVSKDILRGKINNSQSLNRFIYVENNPMKYIDKGGNSKLLKANKLSKEEARIYVEKYAASEKIKKNLPIVYELYSKALEGDNTPYIKGPDSLIAQEMAQESNYANERIKEQVTKGIELGGSKEEQGQTSFSSKDLKLSIGSASFYWRIIGYKESKNEKKRIAIVEVTVTDTFDFNPAQKGERSSLAENLTTIGRKAELAQFEIEVKYHVEIQIDKPESKKQ